MGLRYRDCAKPNPVRHRGRRALFPRAKTATFDNAIARACRKAARLANLNYGRTNGFTCHSLRHTFITDMMEASGNNVALVMSYSGHKSLESFKIYLHAPTHGCTATDQRIESVGLFLASFAGTMKIARTVEEKDKLLKRINLLEP